LLALLASSRTMIRSAGVWKRHTGFRFLTAAQFLLILGVIVNQFAAQNAIDPGTKIPFEVGGEVSAQCISERSRLLNADIDHTIEQFSMVIFGVGNVVAIIGCFCDSLLSLSILLYHPIFLLTATSTLAQGLSGYFEKCFSLVILYVLADIGMLIGLFQLHVLFIYTHRGITIYQWIPMKIGEIYRRLTQASHQGDHLMQKLKGIGHTRRGYGRVPLMEEDQEQFEMKETQLVEKTCIEG
ncbi:hypothetical protein PMAYCL1PPCAC_19183, partial [Pristionchus mayeri]